MGPTSDYSIEQWQEQMNLNLTSTFLVCKHSMKYMSKNDYGRIVTVGSKAALEPGPQMAAYCASKAGVIALVRSIAAETKGTNITANIVLPSIIDTPANRKNMDAQNADRWVKPQSLAQVICFLASEEAADIRGAAVPVYGSV
jgi:NAD(P)-dependent dehydrogenase (short-subunit alcohol dehydrogenase family)